MLRFASDQQIKGCDCYGRVKVVAQGANTIMILPKKNGVEILDNYPTNPMLDIISMASANELPNGYKTHMQDDLFPKPITEDTDEEVRNRAMELRATRKVAKRKKPNAAGAK